MVRRCREILDREASPAGPPVEVIVHRLYNPEGRTQYNIVPGLMGVVLTMTLVMMTSIAMSAGMLPVALGLAGDPSFRAPIGVAVLGASFLAMAAMTATRRARYVPVSMSTVQSESDSTAVTYAVSAFAAMKNVRSVTHIGCSG